MEAQKTGHPPSVSQGEQMERNGSFSHLTVPLSDGWGWGGGGKLSLGCDELHMYINKYEQ
jgi:hypothetical protein